MLICTFFFLSSIPPNSSDALDQEEIFAILVSLRYASKFFQTVDCLIQSFSQRWTFESFRSNQLGVFDQSIFQLERILIA